MQIMRITAATAAALLALGLATGCTNERRTTVRETETVRPAERAAPSPPASESTTIIKKRSERTEQNEEN